MFSTEFFRKLSVNVRDKYRKEIFEKGRDVNDKAWRVYKEPYKSRKQGNKFPFQESTKTTPILTGDLYRDFKPTKIKSTGFSIGWSISGQKVKSLNKQKRELSTTKQPLPEKVLNFITKEIKKEGDRKHIKPKSKTTKLKIGK